MTGDDGTKPGAPRELSLSVADGDRAILLQIGDRVVARLPENAGTGYRWSAESSAPGIAAVAPSGASYPSAAIGSAGEALFVVHAVQAGEARVRFRHARSWEHDRPAVEEIVLQVRVTA